MLVLSQSIAVTLSRTSSKYPLSHLVRNVAPYLLSDERDIHGLEASPAGRACAPRIFLLPLTPIRTDWMGREGVARGARKTAPPKKEGKEYVGGFRKKMSE